MADVTCALRRWYGKARLCRLKPFHEAKKQKPGPNYGAREYHAPVEYEDEFTKLINTMRQDLLMTLMRYPEAQQDPGIAMVALFGLAYQIGAMISGIDHTREFFSILLKELKFDLPPPEPNLNHCAPN